MHSTLQLQRTVSQTPVRELRRSSRRALKCQSAKLENVLGAAASAALSATLLLGSVQPASAFVGKMTEEERNTIDMFKRSTPSVVSVTNLGVRRDAFTMNQLEVPQGTGSGFVWDDQGHIVTNFHVINESANVKVTLGKADYIARVVGVDPDKDIAVLEVNLAQQVVMGSDGPVTLDPPTRAQVPPLCVEPSVDDLEVGQRVYAIGNPFGLEHTLTSGIVSGTGREIQSMTGRPIQGVIQTDAAINPGNSGGPLLDSSGCVIGINTAIFSPSGANTGVGFAIPSDTIQSSVTQILQFGRVVRPMLGISFAPEQAVETLGVKGIMVLNARDGGPANKAGIQGTTRDEYGRLVLGDIIRSVNGVKINTASDLYKILDKCKVGDELDIEVLRGNTTQHVPVTLEANDA